MATVNTFNVAGVSFDERPQNIKKLKPRDPVRLVREPENAFDPNAVRVESQNNERLGYVPKHLTDVVCPSHSFIVKDLGDCSGRPYLKIERLC